MALFKAPNGRYSVNHDLWDSNDPDGGIFHRIENFGVDHRDPSGEAVMAGRAYFWASAAAGESPWLAVIDDFGALVRVDGLQP